MTAVPTVAPRVTNTPSTGPNSAPLVAARIGPGTKIEPSAADTTMNVSGARGPVAETVCRRSSTSTTRATATR